MIWDEYFFDIVKSVSHKSKDQSTCVGCIIVSQQNEIVSTGFNGFPRGVEDKYDVVRERYDNRDLKLLFTEHAERNSIYAAARRGISLDGCSLYVEWCPCADCMRAIIQVGIKEVVLDGRSESFNNEELKKRWALHIQCAELMAAEAGVKLRVYQGFENSY